MKFSLESIGRIHFQISNLILLESRRIKMSLIYESIDEILNKYLPQDELNEINRILYGCQHDERFNLCVILKTTYGLILNLILKTKIYRFLGTEKEKSYDIEKYRFVTPQNGYIPRVVKVNAIQ